MLPDEITVGSMVAIPAGTPVWNSRGSLNFTRVTKRVRVQRLLRGRIYWNEGLDDKRVAYSVKAENVVSV